MLPLFLSLIILAVRGIRIKNMAKTAHAGILCWTEFGIISVCMFTAFFSSSLMIPLGSYSRVLSVSSSSETFAAKRSNTILDSMPYVSFPSAIRTVSRKECLITGSKYMITDKGSMTVPGCGRSSSANACSTRYDALALSFSVAPAGTIIPI